MHLTARHFLPLLILLGCATTRPAREEDSRQTLQLGKVLFFDKRLSANNSMSCATCHRPELAFTNGARVALGVHGEKGERNVPTLVNRAGSSIQFWDGRAASLEDQVTVVITAANEMGSDINEVLKKLNADSTYRTLFREAFKTEGIDASRIARAIAAYERTLRAGTAPYDRYLAGDSRAMNEAQVRGMNLFFREFKCVTCHSGPNFSDETLRPRCYPATNNLSQFTPIRIEKAKWVKTPTLRNLKFTAPYLHNGSLTTLEEVVEFYTPTFQVGPDRMPAPQLPVVKIEAQQKRDLVEFLKSLSADQPYVEDMEAGNG